MPINYQCPISGIRFKYSGFDGLGLSLQIRKHPVVETLTEKQLILRSLKFSQQKFLITLQPTELVLAASALLCLNPLVDIHCPINPDIEFLRDNFSRLYFATGFVRTLRNPGVLPRYSITEDSCHLRFMLDGWIEEVEDEKQKIRKRYREEVLSRMEERFTKKLKTKILGGVTLFHRLMDYKVLEWLFEQMGIPPDDWDAYRKVVYNDIWENLRTKDCSLRLLELEGYLENWISLGAHKPILQRRIHHQLSEFLDMGGSLPASYYTAEGEPAKQFAQQDSFKKIVKPKLAFSPVFAPKVVTNSESKPKKEDFPNLQEFAKAILAWSRKNHLS